MSTKLDPNTAERLKSTKQRVEELVEKKWTPMREKNDSESMEVWTNEYGVYVGNVNRLWERVLRDDLVRKFDDDFYEFGGGGGSVSVCPITASEYYDAPDGMDVKKSAVIKALDETGVHIPSVRGSGQTTWLEHFETREEAERTADVLEGTIRENYEEMWGEGVESLEVRELKEPRDWLAPDSWYSVLVHYE